MIAKQISRYHIINSIIIVIIVLLTYYFFDKNLIVLLGLILGFMFSFIIEHKFSIIKIFNIKTPILFVSIIIIMLLPRQYHFFASFLFSFNLFALLNKYKSETFNGKIYKVLLLESNILNSILISVIIINTALEKFRGYNKLDVLDNSIFPVIIILIILSLYYLHKLIPFLKNTYNIKFLFCFSFYLIGTFLATSYYFYKEINPLIVFTPLVIGIMIHLIERLSIKTNKTISLVLNAAILFFLLPYSYTNSGLLGVSLSLLCSNLLSSFFTNRKEANSFLITKISPILFILATIEYNENLGLINRFNLLNAENLVFLILGFFILLILNNFSGMLQKFFTSNKIFQYFPIAIILFTLVGIGIIIKYATLETLISVLLSCVFYELFIANTTECKTEQDENKTIYLANFIGTIVFMTLLKA